MSKLNKDILFLLFENLQDDSKSLFSCLMVNRLWCETVIPILWKNPWCYNIHYFKNSSLYYIITSYLTDDIKEFLTKQEIQIPQISYQQPLFDYLSFCRSINIKAINKIIYSGSSLAYNRFLLQQEIYNLIIRKCSELKYLNMESIDHPIFYFSEAKVCFDSLCELVCDTHIDPLYFYGLTRICQNIQRITIINTKIDINDGIVKLIEIQKNLKYFEWKDSDLSDEEYITDPYKNVFLSLIKKADTLNHLVIKFCYIDYYYYHDYEYQYLQKVLPELHKLKTLQINEYYYLQMKELVYHNLEVINISCIALETAVCIVKNSGGHLREILFKYDDDTDCEENFDKDSLIFIRKVHENCPLVEYLSLVSSTSNDHFIELEKLLKSCQNLKSLLLYFFNEYNGIGIDYEKKKLENGEKLLKMLIRSAPTNLREIKFLYDFKFSLEVLETFLEKWKNRPMLSILISADPIYNEDNYRELISKYKNNGVIKDFEVRSDIYF